MVRSGGINTANKYFTGLRQIRGNRFAVRGKGILLVSITLYKLVYYLPCLASNDTYFVQNNCHTPKVPVR